MLLTVSHTVVLWAERIIYRHMGDGVMSPSDIFTKRSTSGISEEDLNCGLLGCVLLQVLFKQNVRRTAMFRTVPLSLKAVWSAELNMLPHLDTFYLPSTGKNTSSVCYSTLEVESSRLAVEALDLSNSIKAFSKR